MSTLYVLVGNIGSGKTTWARQQVKANPRVRIVSPDAIRQMLFGDYEYRVEMDAIITDICCRAIHDLLLADYEVVVDACNYTRARRLAWIRVAERLNCKVCGIYFPKREASWHVGNRLKSAHAENKDWKRIWEENERTWEAPCFTDEITVGYNSENSEYLIGIGRRSLD